MYLQLQQMVEVVQHRVYIAPRQVPVSQQNMCGIKSCLLYRTSRYLNMRHQKLCVLTSNRYLNLRGSGSSLDQSRLARRISNRDTPHCRQPSKAMLGHCLTQALRESVSAIVTTGSKFRSID